MNRLLSWIFILSSIFAVDMKAKKKKEFTVNVVVMNQNGFGIKKAKLVLLDKEGEKVKEGKTKKDGSFTFKKLKAGSYILLGEHKTEGDGEKKFNLIGKDLDFNLKLVSEQVIEDNNEEGLGLNKFTEETKLPQQREEPKNPTLKFENLFFEYESNLKALKIEVDSLKSVVKGYRKGETMPNVDNKLLDVIKVPTFQHRVELQNGTVVSGDLIQESDSTLILETQIGRLVLKKEMVVRMDELEEPGPKVIFVGDPFIDYYPDKQIFSGKIKNVGQVRADFVRVMGKLFDQTTRNSGTDSIFVKGKRVIYNSNVVSDTALEPGQIAQYVLTIPIIRGRKAEYHTMDIHWEQTR
ncbi:MAG: SpaA isopeptide-forming pilin-related protein [Fidelibacterota bacterium]|jgi:hypothetical protein|tara:strand:+ start:1503 stop:2558 length:1056 start_codon:yes stop_codon:yes gene_type:complete